MREALIRPAAISHNVGVLAEMAKTPNLLIVVKADGYGHGALTAARAALEGGANWLGTADTTEALELRADGIESRVLAWLIGPTEDLAPALEAGIDLGVSSLTQLDQVIRAVTPGRPARIHLKVDTGLGRSGADPREWEALFQAAKSAQDSGVVVVVGLFTHLSGTSPEADAKQGLVYEDALAVLDSVGLQPEIRHVASSIGTSDSPALAHDMVRVGAAAYGVPVTPRYHEVGLIPAMRVSGQLILVKRVQEGLGVGYGHTYRTNSETTLALVPLGYADGIPRHASNAGPVTIDGQRFRVSGRISMDQFTVDVGDSAVHEGQWAVLWGDPAHGEPSANEWAEAAGTIAYEIVTRLGSRIPRVVA
ncbi:alanine racemase [Pontimonas sp.]|nr:alanine racemase [Pontimonas sp.]MDA8887309.1 alanine racemase [Pontimonas sp.]